MSRTVSILGSTGSVGRNTVDLLEREIDRYSVVALTGGRNIDLLADQACRLKARMAVTSEITLYDPLCQLLEGSGVDVAAGPGAIETAGAVPVDWTMSAIVGAAGLAPGLAAARNGGILALANKESLVCAGELFLSTCAEHSTRLIPVDSEHSAIHQCLEGHEHRHVSRIILTASGGPFRTWSRERMAGVTPEQAKAHPTWDMGERISIDSASMFNKAMEVLEAKYLFGFGPEMIDVVVHPQSIIHSMVEFRDGAVLAHLGASDMRGAIGYALNWPEREPLPVERLDFARIGSLEFHGVDTKRFPALGLAQTALEMGGLSGAAFNAAKEVALDGFLSNSIGFLDMATVVEHVLEGVGTTASRTGPGYGLTDVQEVDRAARDAGRAFIETIPG